MFSLNILNSLTFYFPLSLSLEKPLRLSGEIIPEAGMIIVNKDGVDGFVCNMNWQDNNARVICNQLGYKGGISLRYERKESGPLFVPKAFRCTGSETNLEECNVTNEVCVSDFTASSVSGAFCYNTQGNSLTLSTIYHVLLYFHIS